jgi:hypothetical protein
MPKLKVITMRTVKTQRTKKAQKALLPYYNIMAVFYKKFLNNDRVSTITADDIYFSAIQSGMDRKEVARLIPNFFKKAKAQNLIIKTDKFALSVRPGNGSACNPVWKLNKRYQEQDKALIL